jgi:hypothetical protein
MSVPAPRWFHFIVAVLTAAALFGIGRFVLGRAAGAADDRIGDTLVVLAVAVVVHEVFQLRAALTFGISWAQGRYLFPVFPAAAVLAAIGLSSLVPPSCQRLLTVGVSAALLACTIFLAIAVVLPAYA